MTTTTALEIRLADSTGESLPKVHELFVETIGPDGVEDLDSFRRTVSPLTDTALVPKIVEAFDGSQLIGAMLGVYLRRVNGGMVLYAGVREAYRRRGLYMEMRNSLLRELAVESPTGLGFVLSEVEKGSWLHRKYLDDWGGFDAPLDYVQPAAQGLSRRPLSLVVVPQAADRTETVECLSTILREVFTSVYRISEPEGNPDFLRIMDSIRRS